MKARNFSKIYKKDEFRCPNDGYIYIKNSELLTGNIDKTSIGNSSKNGIVFALIKDNNKVFININCFSTYVLKYYQESRSSQQDGLEIMESLWE